MASVQVRKVGPVREAYVPRGPVPAVPEAIDALVVEGVAGLHQEIRTHRFRLDALRSLDAHLAHDPAAIELSPDRTAQDQEQNHHCRRGEATCRTTDRKPQ